jgi:hypothetical protein
MLARLLASRRRYRAGDDLGHGLAQPLVADAEVGQDIVRDALADREQAQGQVLAADGSLVHQLRALQRMLQCAQHTTASEAKRLLAEHGVIAKHGSMYYVA